MRTTGIDVFMLCILAILVASSRLMKRRMNIVTNCSSSNFPLTFQLRLFFNLDAARIAKMYGNVLIRLSPLVASER